MVLLDRTQFINVIRDLLGPAALDGVTLNDGRSREILLDQGARVTAPLLDDYARIAATAVSNITGQARRLAGCPAGLADDACAQQFIPAFAERAFRRPLRAGEAADLWSMYRSVRTDGLDAALLLVAEAILRSPSVMYRSEMGTPGLAEAPLTAHEMAGALSFLLLDGLPDEPLRLAARNGRLTVPDGIAGEVDRLLAKPEVRQNLTRAVAALYDADKILGAVKDVSRFPQYTPALVAALYREAALFLADVLWKQTGTGVVDLLTSRRTFADGELARLYGERAGLLTQPGWLASLARTDSTSVVARGLFVRDRILCLDEVPSPPRSVAAEIARQLGADATEHERAAYRSGNPKCRGCHEQFDRFGLLFERYDAIGRYRPRVAGSPVDAPVDLAGLLPSGGAARDAGELADLVVGSGAFAGCFTRRLMSWALEQAPDDVDDCAIEAVQDMASPSGRPTFAGLLKSILLAPAFRTRGEEAP